MGRKTANERREAEFYAERAEWESFTDGLRNAQTREDAVRLVEHGPAGRNPGAQFYSNLAYFLQFGAIPFGASEREIAEYKAFTARTKKAVHR